MVEAQRKAQLAHRRRKKRSGIKRVEINGHKDDVALVRQIVRALANPDRRNEVRAWLQDRFGGDTAAGFKAMLAAAPLEGIDLSRSREGMRNIDL